MTRALLYSRVSTITQAEAGFSLAAQRERLAAWCDYQQIQERRPFEDAGVSGTLDSRPGLDALMAVASAGDVLVVHSLSRLGRGGATQTLNIVSKLRAAGARLVSLSESIDTETPTGRLMLTILSALAELELEQTRERSEAGRLQAVREGQWPIGANTVPYGYTRLADGTVVPFEPEARWIRLIFQWAPTHTLEEMADRLNRMGAPTRHGGLWRLDVIQRLLKHRIYAGQLIYRRKSHKKEPVKQHTIQVQPLISEDAWRAAQRTPSSRSGWKRPDKHPLIGHLRCYCGARLVAQTTQGRTYYGCIPKARKTPTCLDGPKCHFHPAGVMEQAARAALSRALLDPADPARLTALYGGQAAPDPHAEAREALRRQLRNLAAMRARDEIEPDDYAQLRAQVRADLAALPDPAAPQLDTAPDLSGLGTAVLDMDTPLLVEWLSALDVEFTLSGVGHGLSLTQFRPNW